MPRDIQLALRIRVITIDGVYQQKIHPDMKDMKREQREQHIVFSPKT